jgi:hypothetical protein
VAIRPAVLHNVSPSEGLAIRERFEHNGRTLAVYRPDIRPASNEGRPSGVARQPQAPSLNRAMTSGPQTSGRGDFARAQSPATQSPGLAIQTPAPADVPRLRPSQPLIVRGSARTPQRAVTSTAGNPRSSVPLNSLVVTGQHRDSRMAATQPDNRTPSNFHNRPALSSSHDWRNSRAASRDDDYSPPEAIRQPQTPAQSTWWASQPQQPRTPNHEQVRHVDIPSRGGGERNASVESPRHNSMPVHSPEQVHSAPIESHQSHSAPVESHVTQSAPPVDHSSHSAPAPSSSSSSSSSSGRGR